MIRYKDLTGKTFGDTSILGISHRKVRPDTGSTIIMWACRCVCGYEFAATAAVARSSLKCRCDRRRKRAATLVTHGASRRGRHTPTYKTWRQMRKRCMPVERGGSPYYGGAGVTVCDRWGSYEKFLADMGEKPTPGHSIDRIDNTKGYEPANCRWATKAEQMRNRRVTVMLTHEGVTLCVSDWARKLGVSPTLLHSRIQHRMTVPDILHPGKHRQRKRKLPRLPSAERG